jgi:hypothetical protein
VSLGSYLEWKEQFLKKVSEDAEARVALQTLSEKCDAELLLLCIGQLVGQGPFSDDWQGLLGFDPRSRATVAKRFGQCADDLERLNSSVLGRFLYRPNVERGPGLGQVPEMLRGCAAFVLTGPKEFRQQPRQHPVSTIIRAFLISYVLERTQRPNDAKLSVLYGVANGKSTGTVSWRQWRKAKQPL